MLILMLVLPVQVLCAAVGEGDIDGDNDIDLADLARLVGRWLDPACLGPACAEDLDGRAGVDMNDLAVLAAKWGITNKNIIISEFMAKNKYAHYATVHGQQESCDWIELYNPGPDGLTLDGWYLTDDEDNLKKFRLPRIGLGPGRYMIVYASDVQPEDSPSRWPYWDGTNYHANFELDGEGEYLALVDPHGYIVHEYKSYEYRRGKLGYPPQYTDYSYGLYCGREQYFPNPTPGRGNTGGYSEVAGEPVFSRPGGTFVNSFQLTIATDSPTAQIHYTTNGTVPTALSPKYTGPLTINTTTEVMARVFESGKAPGPFESRTYIALDAGVQGVNSNVPIVIVDTFGGSINATTYRRSAAVFIDRPIMGGRVNITDPADFAGRCGMRIRGSSTAGQAKKQYSFETWDERDRDKKVSVFSLPEDSDWVLYAPFRYDIALINNPLAYELSRQVGRYACRTVACELYLNTGGGRVTQSDYWGVYYFMEKIRINPDRVDIANLQPWQNEEPKVSGGYILAIDRADPDPGDIGFRTSRGTGLFNYIDKPEVELTTNQKSWIVNWLNQFESALYGSNFANPAVGYARYIDVDSHIDHSLLNLLPMNVDAFRLSGYMYKQRQGKLFAGPIWDFDRAFESTDGRDDNPRTWNGGGDATRYFDYVWYGRLHQDPDFWQRYIDRWYELRRAQFSTENVNATIDALADEIREAAVRNYARWTQYQPRFGGFQGEIDHMKDWLRARAEWIDDQFVKPPIVNPDGGYVEPGTTVTLSNPNGTGTIYYTLDGSDPRLFYGRGGNPGDVSPRARVYTGPITINISTQLKARVRVASNFGSPWSGLAKPSFGVSPVVENLRITEIMYHPEGEVRGRDGVPRDPNEEFIELKNIGTNPINLNLVRFTDGIDFTFGDIDVPPGGYVLVVEDLDEFSARYPTFTGVIAGEYSGKLANEGERITLVDATGAEIANFRYKDGWRPLTDGGGYSLTIIDPKDKIVYETRPGLIGHWQFEEGSGNIAADTAAGNDGILYGDPTWITGQRGGGLNFDGVDDYVALAPVEALAGNSFTIEAWLYLEDDSGAWNPILTQRIPTNNGYYFYVYENKPRFALMAGRGSIRTICPDVISPGQWYHLAGTNDGFNMKLYVNGALKVTAPSSGRNGVDYDAYIGYDYGTQRFLRGAIDEIRLYNWALGEQEFQSIGRPVGRWNEKSSWRTSVYVGGSPGWDDSGIVLPPKSVVINEVLAHAHGIASDWIELHNRTDQRVEISGWFLSDSEDNLTKYEIKEGTFIDPCGYIVFYEDPNFGRLADPGTHEPFALSENGDTVYLYAGRDGELMGQMDDEKFDASERDVSFGYYRKSTGTYNFVPMEYPTPGWPNAQPLVGPIVINEVMYHPPDPTATEPFEDDDDFEYIELYNITAQPVTLEGWDNEKNRPVPWFFSEGITLKFPLGTTIPGHGYLVVARNTAAFTHRYGPLDPGVTLIAYEGGKLANEGEVIQLSKPGDENFKTPVPDDYYPIRVDRLSYSDGDHPPGSDPWPRKPDGQGYALARISATEYGNDLCNWKEALPSPGKPNP